LVGTSSTIAVDAAAAVSYTSQIAGAGSTGLLIYRSTNDTTPPKLYLAKSRGSVGALVAVNAGDTVGQIDFGEYNGVDTFRTALIRSFADGAPGTAPDSTPGGIAFHTTANGSTAPTEHVRLTNTGALLVGTTSTPTGAGSGAVVAESRVVIGAAGGGRHQTIVGESGSVTATTGTVVFKFKSASPTTGRACYVKLAISQRNNNNTPSNSPAAEYAFQLHQTTAGVCTLNSATTIFEHTYVRATHFAFADLGSGECTVTLTNPTGFSQNSSYKVEILTQLGISVGQEIQCLNMVFIYLDHF
jgi:hypothetical protein